MVAVARSSGHRGGCGRRRGDPVMAMACRGWAGSGKDGCPTDGDPDRDDRSGRRGAVHGRGAAHSRSATRARVAALDRGATRGAGVTGAAASAPTALEPARDPAGADTDSAVTDKREPGASNGVSQPARARQRQGRRPGRPTWPTRFVNPTTRLVGSLPEIASCPTEAVTQAFGPVVRIPASTTPTMRSASARLKGRVPRLTIRCTGPESISPRK